MTTTPQRDIERELFEAWAAPKQFDLRRPGYAYANNCTDYAWHGWQARAAQATAEPVASVSRKVAVDALNVLLWLYRRLPREYERPPHVEQPIKALAASVKSDVIDFLAERGAAPDRAPSADSAATCDWNLADEDNGVWKSSCGEAWSFIDGGPKENRVSFCHHCGKSVDLSATAASSVSKDQGAQVAGAVSSTHGPDAEPKKE